MSKGREYALWEATRKLTESEIREGFDMLIGCGLLIDYGDKVKLTHRFMSLLEQAGKETMAIKFNDDDEPFTAISCSMATGLVDPRINPRIWGRLCNVLVGILRAGYHKGL